MASTPTRTSTDQGSTHQSNYSAGAVGMIVFAAVLMVLAGVLQAVQGLVALVDDTFYVVGEEYIFEFDVTTWGWIHLIIGTIVAVAGFGLLQGSTWARVVAVVVASVGIVTNFLWLPYYPLWSLTLLALDVLVLWAVIAHGRDILAE